MAMLESRDKERSRMHKSQSNGIFFFWSFSYQIYFFVCLLLITKLKGEVANITLDKDSSYPTIFLSDTAPQPQVKYDVFVSFRGADIRQGLLSHLVEALSRKQIVFFVDDMLPRGNEISKSLLRAIEGSSISLIIFSQNFASSRWCLEELVKIVECREKYGQILLPIFYKVDPTDVRHQKGTYENAFAEHEKKHSSIRLRAWRSALKESADISGFHSSNFLNDAEIVEEIVKCVLMRLNHVHQVYSKGIVGIGKPISRVESLLKLQSEDVRAIGIWGMGGIGKTTLAEEVYNRLCFEFNSCCFMANVREESGRHGIIHLKKKLFSTLLGEQDLKIDTPNGLPHFVERRLLRMKVLIVLDGVNDSQHLEILVGTFHWFGKGSRIIVTTRDKQVLAQKVVDIYEVKALDFDECLRLFSLNAFEQDHPEIEYYGLSKRMVKYAKGVPLVLKVLGHLLRGKDIKIWESQLERLKEVPIKTVHDAIRLSFNDLDRDEKKIFLDIACFLEGLNLKVDSIKLLLKDRGYSVDAELERLKDKALVTISQDNIVSMHSIVQETAWEIVRLESIEDPGNQSRLLDPDDIYQVLKNDKGSEAIRSIAINLSIIKELQLSPQVFAKMSKLQYLDIYSKGSCNFLQDRGSLYLPQGLESLPNGLRYLRWAHYPFESLPSEFSGGKLVVLNLQYSRVRKLWHNKEQEQEQGLVNLKVLILILSSKLMELPDLSKATNLAVIDLRMCVRLTSVHPSVFSLNKLEKLYLGGCISLTSLRSNIHLNSLRYLSLAGCLSLKDFSLISKRMMNLNLELTGIKQLPSSIGLQSKLQKLRLAYTYIEHLPASVKHLTKLRHLDLRHCRELQTLTELPPSIETLDASGCVSLETVTFPSSAIQQLKENKKRVAFWNCLKLDEHSLKAIGLNAQINMIKFAHQHVISTFGGGYGAQSTYVYPGSRVPEWLVYRATHDHITIDLSFATHSSQLGFIFCFIIPEVASEGLFLIININGGEDEGNGINVYLDRPSRGIQSDHVYLMYDQGCSRYLKSRAKHQPKLEIKVIAVSRTPTAWFVPLQIRGFGVSPINTSQYANFIQQIELADTIIPNFRMSLLSVFYSFCLYVLLPVLIQLFIEFVV